jgi:hypothetical protein
MSRCRCSTRNVLGCSMTKADLSVGFPERDDWHELTYMAQLAR